VKISLSWLREFVDLTETTDELRAILDDLGLVVEGIEHVGEGLEGLAELARGVPPHGHVVLLHPRGRNGVHARRRRQSLHLRHQRRLSVLRDHQA